eukprot:366088-Chlamydomonas_euryale.AAC.2
MAHMHACMYEYKVWRAAHVTLGPQRVSCGRLHACDKAAAPCLPVTCMHACMCACEACKVRTALVCRVPGSPQLQIAAVHARGRRLGRRLFAPQSVPGRGRGSCVAACVPNGWSHCQAASA